MSGPQSLTGVNIAVSPDDPTSVGILVKEVDEDLEDVEDKVEELDKEDTSLSNRVNAFQERLAILEKLLRPKSSTKRDKG